MRPLVFIAILFIIIYDLYALNLKERFVNDYEIIYNQNDFDRLVEIIENKVKVKACLMPGSYEIKKIIHVYDTLEIIGVGAFVKGANNKYSKINAVDSTKYHYICYADDISAFSAFYDDKGKRVRVSELSNDSTYINFCPKDIECIDGYETTGKKIVKIPIPHNISYLRDKNSLTSFAYIDSWWTSPIFSISESDSSFFYCTTLRDTFKENSFDTYINGEKKGYGVNPSIVIYNTEPQPNRIFYDKKYIYIPLNIDWVECVNSSSIHSFELRDNASIKLSGITFMNSPSVINSLNLNGGYIYINNCQFKNISKEVIRNQYASRIKEIEIRNSSFTDCSQIENTFYINLNTPYCKLKVLNSYFNRYTNGFCDYKNVLEGILINDCDSAIISNNIFVNHPRGAAFLRYGNIVVDNNYIYNDSTFNSYPYRNFSRDAGAIYCCQISRRDDCLNNKRNVIELKNNKIYNVKGKGDVRGIFIDDGRGDVKCYCNLIINSQCYSIDARNVKDRPYSSIRNEYKYNIVNIPYRLTYGENVKDENIPKVEENILLFDDEMNNVLTDCSDRSDMRINRFIIDNGKAYIDNEIWETLPEASKKMVFPISITK